MPKKVSNPERDRTLVKLLAAQDAAFRPWRDVGERGYSVSAGFRQNYATAGLPWRSGATTEADRKALERAVKGLAEEGLIGLVRGRAKNVRAWLTGAGDTMARELAGLPSVADAVATMRTLEEAEAAGAIYCGAWVAECAACGRMWGDRDFAGAAFAAELFILPALVRGWAVWAVTVQRHVYYRMTDAGREQLADQPPAPAAKAEGGALEDLYFDSRPIARRELASFPVESGEIGPNPLPVCGFRAGEFTALQAFVKSRRGVANG